MQLESRTLSEMNQLVFKCIKCATIFCQESNRNVLSKYNQFKERKKGEQVGVALLYSRL